MSLKGFAPEPLNVDPTFAPGIRARLADIMSVGPDKADEYALFDLVESVADALHTGKIDFPEHDALLAEIEAEQNKIY